MWGGKVIEDRLNRAYESFRSWRVAERTYTSISHFELATFKMKSLLGKCIFIVACMQICECWLACVIVFKKGFALHACRLQDWPGPCGKAHDTTILTRWLLHTLRTSSHSDHESWHSNLQCVPMYYEEMITYQN